jgi:hypothetical protein
MSWQSWQTGDQATILTPRVGNDMLNLQTHAGARRKGLKTLPKEPVSHAVYKGIVKTNIHRFTHIPKAV